MNITNKNIEEMISKLENEWDETIEYARDLQDAIDALKNLEDDLTPVTDEEYEKSTEAFTRFLKDVKKESFEGEYVIDNIDYDITEEDIDINQAGYDSYEEFVYAVNNKIREIENSLVKKYYITVEAEDDIKSEDELEAFFADEISDATGWLVNTFNYRKIEG